jgi:XTP/dITP diphosphohydrolase
MQEAGFSAEIDENGNSFEENALIKARAVSHILRKTVIADDSGLCVHALNGAPGIYSARYAGQHGDDAGNNRKLLSEMEGVPETARDAVFVCAAAVVFPNGQEAVVRGEVPGVIGYEERGADGFGYDPLFICNESGLRYAEMTDSQKNEISHRKRAFEQLKPILDSYFVSEVKQQ